MTDSKKQTTRKEQVIHMPVLVPAQTDKPSHAERNRNRYEEMPEPDRSRVVNKVIDRIKTI